MNSKVVFVSLVLVSVVGVSTGLNCYNCQWIEGVSKDDSCKESGQNSTACGTAETQCGKIKGKVFGIESVFRTCGSFIENNCEKREVLSSTAIYCGCNSDKCNSGTALKVFTLAPVLTAVFYSVH